MSAMTATPDVETEAPDEPLTAAAGAHAAIAEAARRFRRARRRFLEKEDGESLHALRVAIRRLRAVLTLFRPVIVVPRRLADREIRRVGHDLAEAA